MSINEECPKVVQHFGCKDCTLAFQCHGIPATDPRLGDFFDDTAEGQIPFLTYKEESDGSEHVSTWTYVETACRDDNGLTSTVENLIACPRGVDVLSEMATLAGLEAIDRQNPSFNTKAAEWSL